MFTKGVNGVWEVKSAQSCHETIMKSASHCCCVDIQKRTLGERVANEFYPQSQTSH